jgi:hypothetical protein
MVKLDWAGRGRCSSTPGVWRFPGAQNRELPRLAETAFVGLGSKEQGPVREEWGHDGPPMLPAGYPRLLG